MVIGSGHVDRSGGHFLRVRVRELNHVSEGHYESVAKSHRSQTDSLEGSRLRSEVYIRRRNFPISSSSLRLPEHSLYDYFQITTSSTVNTSHDTQLT